MNLAALGLIPTLPATAAFGALAVRETLRAGKAAEAERQHSLSTEQFKDHLPGGTT